MRVGIRDGGRMDEGNGPIADLVQRYDASWQRALPAARSWEVLAAWLPEPAITGALARHLRERVGILALDLATFYEDPGTERPWPLASQRLLEELLRNDEGVAFPLAVRVHRTVLEGAYHTLRRELNRQSAHTTETLAFDILVVGLAEVEVTLPPALTHMVTKAGPTALPVVAIPMPFPLPFTLRTALDSLSATRYVEDRTAQLLVWRARRDMLRQGQAPVADTLPRTDQEWLLDMRTILPGMGGAVAMERLTDWQRQIVGLYEDGNSRAAIAKELGISLGAVAAARGRARASSTFAATDALVWEAAGLGDLVWARVQDTLEKATPVRGNGNAPPHPSAGATTDLVSEESTVDADDMRSMYPGGGPRPVANRSIVAALLIACRTGLGWDELVRLSPRLPPCSRRTVERRLRAWQSTLYWDTVRALLTPLLEGGASIDWSRARPKAIGRQAATLDLREIIRVERLLRAAERLFPNTQDD